MVKIGVFIVIIGVLLGIYGYGMETTVTTDESVIGVGPDAIRIPSKKIHNIVLLEKRKECLMFSGGLVLIGIILYVAGVSQQSKLEENRSRRACPKCGELIKNEAVKCRFCSYDIEPVDVVLKQEKEAVFVEKKGGYLSQLILPIVVIGIVGIAIFYNIYSKKKDEDESKARFQASLASLDATAAVRRAEILMGRSQPVKDCSDFLNLPEISNPGGIRIISQPVSKAGETKCLVIGINGERGFFTAREYGL